MPLVRTPMIGPIKAYDFARTLSLEQVEPSSEQVASRPDEGGTLLAARRMSTMKRSHRYLPGNLGKQANRHRTTCAVFLSVLLASGCGDTREKLAASQCNGTEVPTSRLFLQQVSSRSAIVKWRGDADVLWASLPSFPEVKIAWHENLGGGSFGTLQAINTLGEGGISIYATDLDGDGDADVLSGSRGNGVFWYPNLTDRIGDACDNCTDEPNPNQENADGDTLGDACDNCPDTTNADQVDQDGDFIGDVYLETN